MEGRFVFVTGGVVSSLGKGVTTAALAALFKARGLRVGVVKIDGYLNVDAGLMSPVEHGEVFVTHDGAETDLDIGNYERFLGEAVDGASSITAGRVLLEVLTRERKGHYLGKTVQVVPHLTNHIRELVCAVGRGRDLTLVEVGGVVGDIESMPFVEAARQMQLAARTQCVFLHLGLVPQLAHGELKTKPLQHSVRALLGMGVQPDVVVCRAAAPLPPAELDKVALFCNVARDAVVCSPDAPNKFALPARLAAAGLDTLVLARLGITAPPDPLAMGRWSALTTALAGRDALPPLRIAVVRKYLTSADNYVSLLDALELAAVHAGCDARVQFVDVDRPDLAGQLQGADCAVVPGGWGDSGVEAMIAAIRLIREAGLPFLGICYGFQLALVELARNVLGLAGAHTEEVAPATPHPVIVRLGRVLGHRHHEDQSLPALLRLGTCTLNQAGQTVFRHIYPDGPVRERFRHRYTFNVEYQAQFEAVGVRFALFGDRDDKELFDAFQLSGSELHIGVQYHPELNSTVFDVNPVIRHLISHTAAKVKARISGESKHE